MPKSTIAGQMVDHENLVITAKASAAEVPGIATYVAPLEEVLANLKEMNPRLETRKGIKQQEIQERKVLLKKAKVLASRIRAALKAHFGLDNERLVEFGARPIRPRTKSQKNNKPEPQTPTPAPTDKP